MSKTASKAYDPASIEKRIFEKWEQGGYFHPQPDDRPRDQRFCMVIPPPNVTGALHLGHALNNTLQDILIRRQRMMGKNTFWLVGTDHAGIATQATVEKRIFEDEKKNRHDLGREELVRRIWEWKEKYGGRIVEQLKLMGCSCDYERERFTLDDICAKAVRHTFFKMFKDGLIYRGKRLVNWDTQLQTAVADDEVYHETIDGFFWHFKYPIIPLSQETGQSETGPSETGPSAWHGPPARANPDPDEPQFVHIATTRPETMLADTAVAVHPEPDAAFDQAEADLRERLKTAPAKEKPDLEQQIANIAERRTTHLPTLLKLRDMANAGRKIRLPLVDREIPLICDQWAKPELGSGCVKITPAHDPNDYDVAHRHDLPMVNVLTPDGKVAEIVEPDGTPNPNSSKYAGLRFSTKGRAKVVEDLEALGLVEKIEARKIEIGHSDRSKTAIEPYLSDQWFVRMGDLEPDHAANVPGLRHHATGLAQLGIDAVRRGDVKFHPPRYEKTYVDWLSEKRDWCISRQLWWGHRIPVWTREINCAKWKDLSVEAAVGILEVLLADHKKMTLQVSSFERDESLDPTALLLSWRKGERDKFFGRYYFRICVVEDDPELLSRLNELDFQQDPDVLDTWFSSALWPHSTLGWPDASSQTGKREWELLLHEPNAIPAKEMLLSYCRATGIDQDIAITAESDPTDTYGGRLVVASSSHNADRSLQALNCWYQVGLFDLALIEKYDDILNDEAKKFGAELMSSSAAGQIQQTLLGYFYPTSVLSTAREIITLWVARMVITGLYNVGDIPFTDVVIHPVIQDGQGRKMSKTLGNGVDPVDIIDVYGADALRFTLADLATETQDIRMPVVKHKLPDGREVNVSDKFEKGRNFCNKLWQAATGYVLRNIETASALNPQPPTPNPQPSALRLEDRWILSRMTACVQAVDKALDAYRLSEAMGALYHFMWDEYCSWYIEMTKPRLADQGDDGNAARQVLLHVLDQLVRLLHPFTPFVTEAIWEEINAISPQRGLPIPTIGEKALVTAAWPKADPALRGLAVESQMETLQAIIKSVREVRTEVNNHRSRAKEPSVRTLPQVVVKADAATTAMLQLHEHFITVLAGCDALVCGPDVAKPAGAWSRPFPTMQVYMPVADLVDLSQVRASLTSRMDELRKAKQSQEARLSNPSFVERADPAVVEQARQKATELAAQIIELDEHLSALGTAP